jgi:nucleotide-binding universal stress UspA family protein
MYKKVVIPLDGSDLAEQALACLNEIKKDNPLVTLVSVSKNTTDEIEENEVFKHYVSEHETATPSPKLYVFPPGMVVPSYVPDVTIDHGDNGIITTEDKIATSADEYLSKVEEKLEEKGFNVTTKVLIGDPVKEIIDFAERQKADLIVMASTGKPSLNRWNMEHIAEKVVKNTKISVMIVRPAPSFVETKHKLEGVTGVSL